MRIDIYGFYKKIPGGTLIIPMLVMALINTLFPHLLDSLGGVSAAMFKNGALTISGAIIFFSAANIKASEIGTMVRRCGILALAKLAVSFVFGFLFVKLFGSTGFAGITTVAFVACICSCNPGMFMSLAGEYGEPSDLGSSALMTVVSMPCWPMLILAASAGLAFNPMDVISAFVPFVLGMIIGNLDPDFGKIVIPANNALLPLLGCCFGASLNLVSAFRAGVSGILLSILYMVLNAPVMIFADRKLARRPGYAGAAWCSVAGLSLSVLPLAGALPEYADTIGAASGQIGLCMILTCIMSPFLTRFAVSRWGSPQVPPKAERPQ